MKELDGGFPVYILDDDTILYTKENINHDHYWQHTVSSIVAQKYKIPQHKLINLPYCQKRARIVKNNFYYGEKISKKLFKKIEKIINRRLNYIYDEHETRCQFELAEFKGLLQ